MRWQQTIRLTKGPVGGQFVLLAAAILLFASGCMSQQQVFTEGRVEDLCQGAVPVCQKQAGCVLDQQHFVRGSFPGDQKIVVHSDAANGTLSVRILLTYEVYPGTELLIQAFDPDCGDAATVDQTNRDFFQEAGDNRTLAFDMALPVAGDHLLQVYSDMTADYLLVADVKDGP